MIPRGASRVQFVSPIRSQRLESESEFLSGTRVCSFDGDAPIKIRLSNTTKGPTIVDFSPKDIQIGCADASCSDFPDTSSTKRHQLWFILLGC